MKRAAVLAALVIVLVLLAHPHAGAENLGGDPFGDITSGKGLLGRYPLSAYSLDTHIDTSLNPSSWGEEAEGLITSVLWGLTRLWNALIFWLVDTAFSLDLLSSDGPLKPIATAIKSINDQVLGDPWMIAAICAAGFWALWKGVVQRKHAEAAGSLAVSFVLVIAVMFVVLRPIQTVGQAATWSNQISQDVLVGTNTGSLDHPGNARRHIMDSMVRAVQIEPWAQLDFGGLSHCVDGTRVDKDGYPRTVKCDDPRRTARRDHMKVVNGMGGYAPRFLALPPGSRARNMEFDALKDGEVPIDPFSGAQFDGYRVDKSDSTAVDIQQSGSADSRLGMAALIALVSCAFGVLFGGLAILIILVQVGALLILAFSPVIMLAAVLPGPGHALAIGWGKKLLLLVLVFKPAFAFVMAMLIVIHTSLAPSSSGMGWVPAYALIGAFYGLVIWKHKWVGEKMQVSSRRDSTRVERTVSEKTVQAGALVAAPMAATWGMLKGRQESALGGQAPGQDAERTFETASSGPQSTPSSERVPGQGSPTLPEHTASSAASSQIPEPNRGGGVVADGQPRERAASEGPQGFETPAVPAVPASPEGQEAQRTNLPLANGKPHQPPEPEFPGLSTPESVVGPQRRYPKVEDLAPPTEYRGP